MSPKKIAVTTKEALQLLGVRGKSLPSLMRMAGMMRRPGRRGFTAAEVRHLHAAVRQAVHHNKS